MAATWGTPTTWADFLTWAGDTAAPAAIPGGAPWSNLLTPIDYLALVHADDDDALLTAF